MFVSSFLTLVKAVAPRPAAVARGGPWFLPFLRPNVEEQQQELQQLWEMFPQVDRNVIAADLARTGSVEETIENLVEGRVPDAMGAALGEDDFEELPHEVDELANNDDDGGDERDAEPEPYLGPPAVVAQHPAEVRRRLVLEAAMRRAVVDDQ
jgi:hypothetical protein